MFVLFLERGADRSLSESGAIFSKEDSVPSLEALRTYRGGEVHGSVGPDFNTNSTLQSAMPHLSRLQANGRTLPEVCVNFCIFLDNYCMFSIN